MIGLALSHGILKTHAPDILVFDSGLGGLTVYREIVAVRPCAQYRYVADDVVFPYGELDAETLIARVSDVLAREIAARPPDVVVIACNTASTLVLSPLRAAWPAIRFVGTVPAVKPAAEQSRSHLISVLATPGTVARDYTRDLIDAFADHCDVELVGSRRLATLAEMFVRGATVPDADVLAEIAPCFVTRDGRRTDHVVLACTHYPLLLEQLKRIAPWPVEWIDPAPAIARQVERLLLELGYAADVGSGQPDAPTLSFTSGRIPDAVLKRFILRLNLAVEDPTVEELAVEDLAVEEKTPT